MIAKSKLAQIHIAKAQLGLDDEAYRAVLARAAGVSSARDLDDRGVSLVLNEFKRLGFVPKAPKRAGRVPNTLNKREQMAKIEALLSEMGLSWEYAQAIAKRQTGIERIDWLRTEKQFRGVIAALDVEHEKRCGLSAVDEELARLGLTRDQVVERYGLSPGWQRNRKSLAALVEYLRSIKRPD